MAWDGWLTITVIIAAVVMLALGTLSPEWILLAALASLIISGAIEPAQALAGFASTGLMTVALMYVIVAGIRETGGVRWLVEHVLGRPRDLLRAQLRLMLPVVAVSGFLNNTPVVATFIPAIQAWSRRIHISPSRLLIPLSYAAILGGTCTLIGTSTNLIVSSLAQAQLGLQLHLFTPAWIGVPLAVTGIIYILLVSRYWLPERVPATQQFANPREYTVELLVDPNGPLVGKGIGEAGLRHLQGLYLVEIERAGQTIPAVGPQERLRSNDRLVFAGVVDSVVELQRLPGLKPVLEPSYDPYHRDPNRQLFEVVLSPHAEAVGQTVRESRFRGRYNAAVIAIARNGERIGGKLGDVRLRAADTLLLDTHPDFHKRYRDQRDFLLISGIPDSNPPRYHRAGLAWSILGGVVTLATAGLTSMFIAALTGALLMLLTRCLSLSQARQSLEGQVLLAIAAAYGLGQALEQTGAAVFLAEGLLSSSQGQPWLTLAMLYGITWLLTELVTNNAVAVVMFPIAVAAAEQLGISPLPLIITIMVAASASFSTPLGYQTNLMVYGPGGYRYSDYLRFGLPLNLLLGSLAILLIPQIWPWSGHF